MGNSQAYESALKQTKRKDRIRKFWNVVLWLIIVVLVVALLVRLFVYSNIRIDGESMTSSYYGKSDMTYHDGEIVHVLKLAYPKRGDVVVFYEGEVDSKLQTLFSDKNKKLIKRTVALAGDKLWIEQLPNGNTRLVIQTADGDTLYENYYTKGSKLLDEEAFYLADNVKSEWRILQSCTEEQPFVVSKGHFFAMGDNRTNSRDSRTFGEVSLEQLYGVVWEKK